MHSTLRWNSRSMAACLAFVVLSTSVADDDTIRVRNDELLTQLDEEWGYPQTRFSGRGRTGSIRTLVQNADDSYAKVWHHYAEKCGFELTFDEALFVMGREVEGTVYLVDDRASQTDGTRARTFFVCNAPNHSVTVILEPQAGEKPTRIYVTITAR